MLSFKIHSPIQEIKYNVPKGTSLFIKRDDLIDPLISGNKWRKLKHTLLDARAKNKNTLVSFGGAYSNHLLALASASAKFNFKSIAFVRGDEVRSDSEYITFCKMFGMQIIKVSREDYKDKITLFNNYFKSDESAYFIDEGGLSSLGALGCEEIIDELQEEYTDIFLAAGTGCTSAGIINGISKHQYKTKVHSVVVHQGINEIKENIESLTSHPGSYWGSLLETKGRYAQTTPELLNFCIDFQKNTGILLDPIYTGKALFKCYEWMENNPNSKVLFIHTGGILGNLGKFKDYEHILNS